MKDAYMNKIQRDAREWLCGSGRTQEKLANIVNEHGRRSGRPINAKRAQVTQALCLSESPNEGTKLHLILEAIEVIVARGTHTWQHEPDDTWNSDEEHAYVMFSGVLHWMGSQIPAIIADRIGELVIRAISGPEAYRVTMIEQVLAQCAICLDPWTTQRAEEYKGGLATAQEILAAPTLSEGATLQMRGRIEKLMNAVDAPTVDMKAHAGYALFFGGDRTFGWKTFVESLSMITGDERCADLHWENAFSLIERRLEGNDAEAAQGLNDLVNVAQRCANDGGKPWKMVLIGWRATSTPLVREILRRDHTDLATALTADRIPSSDAAIRSGAALTGFVASAVLAAMVIGAVGSWMVTAIPLAAQFLAYAAR